MDNYKIGHLIGNCKKGTGAFSIVKEGRSNITGQKVAIKIYEKRKFQESAKKKCIQQEIEILRQLNHKNIVKLFEIIETGLHVE